MTKAKFYPSNQNLFSFDQNYSLKTSGYLAGVDEAGRGPLAGPVVAAAVIFHREGDFSLLNDSKKITPKRRELLFNEILRCALVGIGIQDAEAVDKVNIYQATRLAMRQAVLRLTQTPSFVLIDGNMKIDFPLKQEAVVKGDQKSASIAAASVIAKVCRDRLMEVFDQAYPNYLFKKHKGYGTPEHLQRIKQYGPCIIHRRTFSPISQYEKVKP